MTRTDLLKYNKKEVKMTFLRGHSNTTKETATGTLTVGKNTLWVGDDFIHDCRAFCDFDSVLEINLIKSE